MAGDSEITFEALRNVRLGSLGQAGEHDWREQVQRLEGMREHKRKMVERAREADWEGENANITRPIVEDQGEQYEAAIKQARSLAEICEDGYRRLRICQTDLDTAVSDAESKGLTVHDNGTVSSAYAHPGIAGAEYESTAEDVAAAADEIAAILQRAAEADAALAQALRDTAGDDPARFNPVEYTSLSAAETAYRDAQRVIELAERGGDLTDEELQTLISLLKRNADDPAFAENIALGLGPQGTLEFWTELSNSRSDLASFSGDSTMIRSDDTMAELQREFGNMLGLATQGEGPTMGDWEREMLLLGDEKISVDGVEAEPYGYQVMSNLMRHGEYDSDFLVQYGNRLLDFERASGNPSDLWGYGANGRNQGEGFTDIQLDFTERGDAGGDPVVGLLEALGRNPDASTQFFAPPSDFDPTVERSEINEDMRYLATGREWPQDTRTPEELTGTVDDSLGHALYAATSGLPFEPMTVDNLEGAAPGDRRDLDNMRVMEEVIELFGVREPTLIHENPAFGDSLGAMAAMYIDDIDYAMSGASGSSSEEPASDLRFSPPYDGHIGNEKDDVIRFLSVLGQDEQAHALATEAQTVYTLSNLDRFDPTDNVNNYSHGAQSVVVGAEVQRVLDDARVAQVADEFGADAEQAEEELARSNEWRSTVTEVVLGGATAAITTPFVGPYSSVIAPAVGDAGAAFLGTYLEQHFSPESDPAQEAAEQSRLSAARYYELGSEQYGSMMTEYNNRAHEAGVGANTIDMYRNDVTAAYPEGYGEVGQPPAEEGYDQ
jgi:hypothetical protein